MLVSFGKRRIYSGVISSILRNPPEGFKPKEILDFLDETPLIRSTQLQLWAWMSSYYMCRQGEVMRAALPSGLRPESESRVRISPDYEDDGSLDSHERLLFEVVKDQGEVCIGDLEMTGISRNPLTVLKRLIEQGAVELNETVRRSTVKRSVSYLQLASGNGFGSVHSPVAGQPGQGTQTEGASGAIPSVVRNRSERQNYAGIKKQV